MTIYLITPEGLKPAFVVPMGNVDAILRWLRKADRLNRYAAENGLTTTVN